MEISELQQVALEILHHELRSAVSLRCMAMSSDVRADIDNRARELVMTVEQSVLGNRNVTREVMRHAFVPADWWQGVRERWLPAWWLRRWPVKFRPIPCLEQHREVYRSCPHLGVDAKDRRHVVFCIQKTDIDKKPLERWNAREMILKTVDRWQMTHMTCQMFDAITDLLVREVNAR